MPHRYGTTTGFRIKVFTHHGSALQTRKSRSRSENEFEINLQRISPVYMIAFVLSSIKNMTAPAQWFALNSKLSFSMSGSISILHPGESPELTSQVLALSGSEYLVGWFSMNRFNFIEFLEV